ncbi:MAG TPA: lactate utilization protein [Armatimonadota bacterium]|jgi:L-lactate dehydrogenase complex protein LldG
MTFSQQGIPLISDDRSGSELFEEFAACARLAAAEVHCVASLAEAQALVRRLIAEIPVRRVLAAPCPLYAQLQLDTLFLDEQIPVSRTAAEIAAHAPTADLGITGVEFGVAETGSVLLLATSAESRLASSLPPVHLALLRRSHVLAGMAEAIDAIAPTFDRGCLTFITGPSRTADIERVLTIGVHGPSRLVILAVADTCVGGDE